MAERVFARKLNTSGFVDVERGEERPVGIEDCALYPLFTAELLDLMQRHIPRERWAHVARSVVFMARKGTEERRRTTSMNRAEVRTTQGHDVAALPRSNVIWDFGAAGCEEGVLLKIRNLMAELATGQVLELRSTDSGVKEDLPAWCRMTGQDYLGASGPRYFVRKR